MNSTSIFNPMVRYTKNDLKERGFKLAFFDVCYLSDLIKPNKPTFNKKLLQETMKLYKKMQIRPVVNLFLFGELLNGLDRANRNYYNDFEAKKLIMEFLDELESLWILSHDEIKTFELINAYHGNNKSAHGFFNVFCACPLFTETSINCNRIYAGDQVMNYIYKLDEASGKFKEFLYRICKDLTGFQETYRTGVSKNNKAKEIILEEIIKNPNDEFNIKRNINRNDISTILKKHCINYQEEKIEKLLNDFSHNFEYMPGKCQDSCRVKQSTTPY
jgi:hypothetical protein